MLPGISNESPKTILAGVIGALIVFGAAPAWRMRARIATRAVTCMIALVYIFFDPYRPRASVVLTRDPRVKLGWRWPTFWQRLPRGVAGVYAPACWRRDGDVLRVRWVRVEARSLCASFALVAAAAFTTAGASLWALRRRWLSR